MSTNKDITARREPVLESGPQARVEPADRPAYGDGAQKSPRPRRKRTKKKAAKPRRSFIGRLVYWMLVLGLWGAIGATGTIVWVAAHLPAIQSLEIPPRPPSIQILDEQLRPLATRGDHAGAVLALKELPTYLPNAFLAIEDRRFYSHFGVDPVGIARAAVANVLHRGISQGASTLSQQLAKNLFLTQERTMHRKVQELMLALWIERKFTKTEILELYLNRVYFGSGAWGIEQAAQRYFGKSARQISLGEAAMLAGLVKSPSRLAPTRNFDGATQRSQIVLAAMQELGFVNPMAAKAAMAKPPRIVAQAVTGSVQYVADWVMDALNDQIGRIDEDVVVVTTIDARLQASAEKALSDVLNLKGEKGNVAQGAVVAMTPDGAVRALVGGRDYTSSQFNRAVSARRQPGSSFKPFVYLTAIEHGLTPDTLRDDKPIKIKGWQPENYHHEYFGPVTLTKALSLSLNTVSVRLTMEFTPMAIIRTAHRMGIASKLEPNASISLGTSEVSVLELVGAYAPFANGGSAVMPHVIERVSTSAGKVLYAHDPRPLGRIVDANAVAAMNTMMRETLTAGTAHGAQFQGYPAAGKTGTSQEFRDAWFIGYTANLVAGVWLGNDDGTPTKKVTGGGLPVEIWSRFMRDAHQGVAVAELPGASSGGFLSSLTNFASSSPPARPGAPVPAAPNSESARGGSLDGWLLDRLFGSR